MKECINCKAKNRDTDQYCRNCGCYMQTNKHYVLFNIMIVFLIICILTLVALFIASYIM